MARVCPGDGLPVAGGIALEAYRPAGMAGGREAGLRAMSGRSENSTLVLRLTAGRGFVLLGELDRHDVAHGQRGFPLRRGGSFSVSGAPLAERRARNHFLTTWLAYN